MTFLSHTVKEKHGTGGVKKKTIEGASTDESSAPLSMVFPASSSHFPAFFIDPKALSFEGGIFLNRPFSRQSLYLNAIPVSVKYYRAESKSMVKQLIFLFQLFYFPVGQKHHPGLADLLLKR